MHGKLTIALLKRETESLIVADEALNSRYHQSTRYQRIILKHLIDGNCRVCGKAQETHKGRLHGGINRIFALT